MWLSTAGAAWLVPPSDSAHPLGFELGNALHHVTRLPFVRADERAAGFARAARWMEKVAEADLTTGIAAGQALLQARIFGGSPYATPLSRNIGR